MYFCISVNTLYISNFLLALQKLIVKKKINMTKSCLPLCKLKKWNGNRKTELFTGFPGEKKLCPKDHTMILSAITIHPRIFFPVGIK